MVDRFFIHLEGDDRLSFLQSILTQDVQKLVEEKILFAGLLSPQGKLLHDLFLIDRGDHVLIDTDATHGPTLLKRLTMYKLRARVSLRDASADWQLIFSDDGLADPRHVLLPHRLYLPANAVPPVGAMEPGEAHVARLQLGIPQLGDGIAPDTVTAMDAGYDALNAISFTKGCYVGQEVTARMHYKSIARKGFFLVRGLEPLTVGAAIEHAGRIIGQLTCTHGSLGLALLKFDDALAEPFTPQIDQQPVRITLPAWMEAKRALYLASLPAQ